jgi:hypothetical protein
VSSANPEAAAAVAYSSTALDYIFKKSIMKFSSAPVLFLSSWEMPILPDGKFKTNF